MNLSFLTFSAPTCTLYADGMRFVCRKMKGILHKWKIGKLEKRVRKDIWEEDYELIENEGLFQEYLEMGQLSSRL